MEGVRNFDNKSASEDRQGQQQISKDEMSKELGKKHQRLSLRKSLQKFNILSKDSIWTDDLLSFWSVRQFGYNNWVGKTTASLVSLSLMI